MKRKCILKTILLVMCFILLTGCIRLKEDRENAKNYKEFLMQSFKEVYNKELIIDSVETVGENKEDYKMKVHLKEDPNFTFNACTYWYSSGHGFPQESYGAITNYNSVIQDNKYSSVIEDFFKKIPYVTYSKAYDDGFGNSNPCGIKFVSYYLYMEDITYINSLSKDFVRLSQNIDDDEVLIYVKYKNNSVVVFLDENNQEEYLEILKLLND